MSISFIVGKQIRFLSSYKNVINSFHASKNVWKAAVLKPDSTKVRSLKIMSELPPKLSFLNKNI